MTHVGALNITDAYLGRRCDENVQALRRLAARSPEPGEEFKRRFEEAAARVHRERGIPTDFFFRHVHHILGGPEPATGLPKGMRDVLGTEILSFLLAERELRFGRLREEMRCIASVTGITFHDVRRVFRVALMLAAKRACE